MKITDHIKNAKNLPLFSFELLPPVKGDGIGSIFKLIDELMPFNPSFIDVTYHRQDYTYVESPDGKIEKRPYRKRPGTVGISAAVINRYNVDVVPHMVCGGFSKQVTEDALIDLHFLGIHNILALQGDKLSHDKQFIAEKDGHEYASDLLEQIIDMNNEKYIDPDLVVKDATNFCVGVAGYPEKHYQAANMETDMYYLKKKIDMGAEFVITQMFFDNQKYFSFVDKCREMGINVPIIPGLKPITSRRQLQILPSTFFMDIPIELTRQIEEARTGKEVRNVGREWCTKQCQELIEYGVPSLHFYTMGKINPIKQIAADIFGS